MKPCIYAKRGFHGRRRVWAYSIDGEPGGGGFMTLPLAVEAAEREAAYQAGRRIYGSIAADRIQRKAASHAQ